MVADQQVAGDFQVGYVRRMKPIIMLGLWSTVVGGFKPKLNLNHYQNLLSDVLSRALQFQKRYSPFINLYRSVSNKIHSGPGYRRRKCSKMKQVENKTKLRNIKFVALTVGKMKGEENMTKYI